MGHGLETDFKMCTVWTYVFESKSTTNKANAHTSTRNFLVKLKILADFSKTLGYYALFK
jgi:hypothetical protein